ncbi:MAG TPA: peptidase [Thermoanaerobaculia bacterium]|nr:peptidase [Thermoanaerobaculia bacterium]
MRGRRVLFLPIVAAAGLLAASPGEKTVTAKPSPPATPVPYGGLAVAPDIRERLRQYPKTKLDFDRALLDPAENRVLLKLIDASRILDSVFLAQVSEENAGLRVAILRTVNSQPAALEVFRYFSINKGPWDRLKGDEPFLGSKPKPPGAAFYPTDMTRGEFEKWVAAHPGDKAAFQGLFTVIRRDGGRLAAIPYSKFYGSSLKHASERVKEAGELTKNASLKKYLTLLSEALLSDDYYASDLAWMDLDSEIEVILGPYEVYEDGLFNYKAAFESFVSVRDKAESAKLAVYAEHLPDMERNLPIPDAHKNFNRKFESPIRVVQEVYTAGDARKGVQTAAFNLPNDERVREAKGSKKVLLRNVMEAKFRLSGQPIAERVLEPAAKSKISFEAYFNDTLFHELSHGLGPGVITGPDGKKVESRLLLKNLYSTIEECKADVVGIWNILFAMEKTWLTGFDADSLFATYAGLMFRSMRFGVDEAHGGGTAVQWNWCREKKAIEPAADGRFRVNASKFREAIRSLSAELLEIEATGDLERAKKLLDRYGKATPEIRSTIAKLTDIPVDIEPVFAAAGEK